MADYNNAAHSVEENLQRISIIDNQLNVTEDFAGGYVEDMMIDEVQPNVAMNVDLDDEGVDLDILNEVMVRRKTLHCCGSASRMSWGEIPMYLVLQKIFDGI
ncbi:hypothetical protein JTB14_010611 [Gonioctena quinquepunctata]|nr:hypothetical protein JTB14_010611 [Gonioctena quinquepunctata]